ACLIIAWEQAMNSILTYYLASKTIDTGTQGFNDTNAVIIVSDEFEELSETINKSLGRTVTRLHGRGGFHPKEKDIVYVVIIRLEISKLKNIIYETEPNAFITIMDAQEARGGKFYTAIH